jgi:anti-repressor protein
MRLNQLQVFENSEFGQVRTMLINGEPYFVGKDITDNLGYQNGSRDIERHVDAEDRAEAMVHDGSQHRNMIIINESGLYSLILGSKLPSAKRFKRWVTSEVLPSIRQNGGYISNQENLTPEQIVAQALIVANNIIQEKDRLLAEQKPKVEFFDTVANSKTALPMDRVAKVLDMGIGRNKLFELLRDKKILDRNNIPYQTYVDRGYFRVIEQKYTKPTGETVVTTKTLVYQRGVDYIRKIVA